MLFFSLGIVVEVKEDSFCFVYLQEKRQIVFKQKMELQLLSSQPPPHELESALSAFKDVHTQATRKERKKVESNVVKKPKLTESSDKPRICKGWKLCWSCDNSGGKFIHSVIDLIINVLICFVAVAAATRVCPYCGATTLKSRRD